MEKITNRDISTVAMKPAFPLLNDDSTPDDMSGKTAKICPKNNRLTDVILLDENCN